jgi:hypothetical protein
MKKINWSSIDTIRDTTGFESKQFKGTNLVKEMKKIIIFNKKKMVEISH